jgi:hypothetical protein
MLMLGHVDTQVSKNGFFKVIKNNFLFMLYSFVTFHWNVSFGSSKYVSLARIQTFGELKVLFAFVTPVSYKLVNTFPSLMNTEITFYDFLSFVTERLTNIVTHEFAT